MVRFERGDLFMQEIVNYLNDRKKGVVFEGAYS